jgi:glycerophosphoryl diester phosphodiesterase
MLIYAHRGSSGTEPENTIRAFRQAITDGAGGVELDVHLSSDGVPVVIHDRDVSRTTNGTGNIDELNLGTIKGLDAGNGERVPTLTEVLHLVAGKLKLYVEVKQAGIAQTVIDVLEGYPNAEWLIASFDLDTVRQARSISATAELWPISVMLTDEVLKCAVEVRATAVSLHSIAATADTAEQLSASGLGMAVWTVNDVSEAHRVQQLGAVALCTDVPATIVPALAV